MDQGRSRRGAGPTPSPDPPPILCSNGSGKPEGESQRDKKAGTRLLQMWGPRGNHLLSWFLQPQKGQRWETPGPLTQEL